MNIVFLFNPTHESLSDLYGFDTLDILLGAQVLQKSDRSMRLSQGDILTYREVSSGGKDDLITICREVYQPHRFDHLKRAELELTHGEVKICGWLFQNMTESIGEELHSKIASVPAYLGAMDVTFSNPLHLHLFRNSLFEQFRIKGKHCSIFYTMGENDDPDVCMEECFQNQGYSFEYEDIGFRGTIFGTNLTIEHFVRAEEFEKTFSYFSGLSLDVISDFIHTFDELDPEVLDELSHAAWSLAKAETDQDLDRAGWEARQFLKKTTDFLLLPKEPNGNNGTLGLSDYKKRIRSYIQETGKSAGTPSAVLSKLGKEADRIFDFFHAGLPLLERRKKVEAAFVSLVIWLSEVIALSPSEARRPNCCNDE